MVTPPPIETTTATKLIQPTVVTNQANRRRPGQNGMASTAEATEPTALAVQKMLAALPPPPPPGVASVDEFGDRRRESINWVKEKEGPCRLMGRGGTEWDVEQARTWPDPRSALCMEDADDTDHQSRAEDEIGYSDKPKVTDPSSSYFLGLPLVLIC
ncbi:hypothetical protein RHSIM_Rhsim06G0094800 [Rhododendron simsii]|uniref:Uncharacterized protein n=1 Tax=Rhododendron simsii TaxID=118357 RepID=A0A834GYR0_RHOSS|nr:hypothetical protein RHSIM_Rhsim06G0094800 [Rhododendron simsii]